MNLGDRIKKALEMAGTKAPDVARASGVPVANINALMRRSSKRSEFTEAILAVLPSTLINVNWVRTGQGTPEPTSVVSLAHPGGEQQRRASAPSLSAAVAHSVGSEKVGLAAAPLRSWDYPTELPPGEWVFLPKLGVMHSGSEAQKNEIKTVLLVEEIQAFKTGWIREDQLRPVALAWHDAIDASMDPAICKGDSFVIDTSTTDVIDGKTYAVWYGGALRPRRLFMLPSGGLRLAVLNAEFATVDIAPDEAKMLRIVGRIVHRAGRGGL